MTTAILTTKGQIVIPSAIRKRMNMKKGTKLCIEEMGDKIIIKPLTRGYFEKIAGVLSTKGKLTAELLKERSKDKEREG